MEQKKKLKTPVRAKGMEIPEQWFQIMRPLKPGETIGTLKAERNASQEKEAATMRLKKETPPLLAWMQPDGSKRQQILTVALVPNQPDQPFGLYSRIMNQQAGKIYTLLKRSQEEYQEGRRDLESLLNSLGLLPPDVEDLNDWDFVNQITDDGQELMTWIRPRLNGEKELKEIPGARELYENLTLEEWMKALDDEVTGR